MKKMACAIMILCLALGAACSSPEEPVEEPAETPVAVQTPLPSPSPEPEPVQPIETPPPPPEETETPPQHSELYIEGLSVDDVIRYYAEVALNTEFGSGADFVRKWTEPIYYRVFGFPSERDLEVLESFVTELNSIEGFPGMQPTTDDWLMNLEIYFYEEQDFNYIMGDDYIGCWGGVSFDFSLDDHSIYWEKIAVRIDIPQENRDSIIIEEIYNGLGPVMDTEERTDSIIYQYSDLNTAMSAVDKLLLRLHYSPQMLSGMDYEGCAGVIGELYY